ncbi:MAG: DNA polymerase III subunit delta', partial [Roseiflexus castenholzii]
AVVHIDRRDELVAAAAQHTVPDLHAFVSGIALAAQRLRDNVNPQLALEGVALAIPERRTPQSRR